MILYKKLSCVCSHEFSSHIPGCRVCLCKQYDANGHNPELENVVCPECKLTHLERVDNHYICVVCQCTLSEATVLEMVG